MTNSFEVEYWEDEDNTLLVKLNSTHVPVSDDKITINEKHWIVYNVEHVLNSEDTVEEKFIVTVHKKKVRW
jgi:hypothetical protein